MRLRREHRRRRRRALRQRSGETGLHAVGRFSLFLMSSSPATRSVVLLVNNKGRTILHQQKRGPRWVRLNPNHRCVISVLVSNAPRQDLVISLDAGDQRVLYVEPLRSGKVEARILTPQTAGVW